MRRLLTIIVALLLLPACARSSLERQLLGSWSSCSIDVRSVTSLRPDHTFSERFVGSNADSYSGTWRVEGNQLVLKISSTDENLKDKLGTEIRLIVSNLQNDNLVATLADNQKKALPWKRVP